MTNMGRDAQCALSLNLALSLFVYGSVRFFFFIPENLLEQSPFALVAALLVFRSGRFFALFPLFSLSRFILELFDGFYGKNRLILIDSGLFRHPIAVTSNH